MKKSVIYKISNNINNKLYIGSTSDNLYFRYGCHICNAFSNKKKYDNYKLYNFMKEVNNIEHFKIEIIEDFYYNDIIDLKIRESYFIIKYDTIKNGYNIRLPYNQQTYKYKDFKKRYYENNKEYFKNYHKMKNQEFNNSC